MEVVRYQTTERTRALRLPERAAYDRATVHAILDECLRPAGTSLEAA
jgi:hypothetical protein